MKEIKNFFVGIFKFHKLKIFIAFGALLGFYLINFPSADLRDIVTKQVAELTGNKIFLQFDQAGFSLIPNFGITLTRVEVDTPFTPPIKAKALSVAPSVLGLLTFNPGVSVSAEGFLNGDIDISTRGSGKNKAGVTKQKIMAHSKDTDLSQLADLLNLPVTPIGKLGLDLDLTLDPSFSDAMEGSVESKATQVSLGASQIPTQFGPFPLPPMSFKGFKLKGAVKDDRLNIEKLELGDANDQLSLKVNGTFNFKIAGGVQPNFIPGAYDLNVDINGQNELFNKFALIFAAVEKFKKNSGPNQTNYAFRIFAQSIMSPPNFSNPK